MELRGTNVEVEKDYTWLRKPFSMVTIIKRGASPDLIREKIRKALNQRKKQKLTDLAGKLAHTDIDPLLFQKKMRDEWV